MKRMVAVSMFGVLILGCASTPLPDIRGGVKNVNNDETGKQYCQRLSSNSDSKAQKSLIFGITGSLLASASIIAGAAMGPDTSNDANWAERNRNTFILGLGAIIAIPSTIFLMRSSDMSTASSAAGKAMGLDNEKAMSQCLQVRADLVGARSQAANYAKDTLGERIKSLQDIIDKNKSEAVSKEKEAEKEPDGSEKRKQKQNEADEARKRASAASNKLLQELLQPPEKI